MATNANAKDFFTFPADPLNAFNTTGRTVGAAMLTRALAWMNAVYADQLLDSEGAPRSADANDLSAYVGGPLEATIKAWEKSGGIEAAIAAVADPDDWTEVV